MSWRHSDVDILVWLGVNGVWPSHIVRQADDRHVCWEYEGERPQYLIDKFFASGNIVRQVLDIRRRVLKRGLSAGALASERMPFEPPLR
jgi:hypothetical protein